MKSETRRKIFLGIFILTGLTLFVASIFLIGLKQDIFRKTIKVSAVFGDVKGLRAGDNVRYLGVRVGLVDEVTILNDTAIQVDIKLQKSAQTFIRKNAFVSIGTDGLVGSKIALISPDYGSAEFIENEDSLASIEPFDSDEMLEVLEATMLNVERGTYNFNENMKALQKNFLLRRYFNKNEDKK